MTTVTVQIPNSQMGWFEQMIQSMGWKFRKEESVGKSIDAQLDELLAMFSTDQISQEEIDHECELVREELYNERQTR